VFRLIRGYRRTGVGKVHVMTSREVETESAQMSLWQQRLERKEDGRLLILKVEEGSTSQGM
jgi:hypothetical protein